MLIMTRSRFEPSYLMIFRIHLLFCVMGDSVHELVHVALFHVLNYIPLLVLFLKLDRKRVEGGKKGRKGTNILTFLRGLS